MIALAGSPAGAMPRVQIDPAPGVLLIQGGAPSSVQQSDKAAAPSAPDLQELLGATRTKIEKLTEATAALEEQAELGKELQALRDEHERLAAELEQTNAERADLERTTEARLAELTEAVEAERRNSARLNQSLAELRGESVKLKQSLARAKAALDTALAEVEKAQDEAAAKVEAANDELEQLRAELDSRGEELESSRKEVAGAHEAREQAEARIVELENAVERHRADAEQRQAELAQRQEQLDQAAGVAVAAERERQAALSQAEAARGEAERAREELAAARQESATLKTAKADLEEELASMQADSNSATETARLNLALMEERLNQLNAVLDRMRSLQRTAPAREAVENDRTAAIAPSLPAAEPDAPAPADEPDAGRPDSGAAAASTPEPDEAPADDEAALERFRADIQALNRLELSAAGRNLFSGVEQPAGGEVRVIATSAWTALPPIGQDSYLHSLLDAWVAVQKGDGPAVVRVVDSNGEVLGEKARLTARTEEEQPAEPAPVAARR